MTKYVKGWVACIENKDGSRFPNGSFYLYSEPHPTEKQAQDWAWAHDSISGCNLIRIECNDVPEARLVRPLQGDSKWQVNTKWVITIKKGLVPTNTMYHFADPNHLAVRITRNKDDN